MNIIDLPDLTTTGLNIIRPNSRVCLLLDYPSENDIKERKPLSDSAGAILSISLNQAGLTLAECSVVYVIPDARTLATLYDVWTPKHGFTTLGNNYIETVKDALTTINPNVVISVGEIALQAVTSKRSITKWRGSILESSIKICQKVVPTLAARDCTKMYIWRYFMASDIKKAAGEAFTPAINLPQRNLHIEPSFQEAMAYMMMIKMQDVSRIAVDIECIKGQPQKGITCISLARSPIDCMSIPFDNRWTEMEELELWKMLAEVLEDASIEKVYQNGADFDIVYLIRVHNVFNKGYIHDTMVKHALNYPDFPKSLAFLTSIYTNEPYYKDDGKEGKVGNSQQREFFIYNAKDSAVDFEINDKIQAELVKHGNTQTYDFLAKLMEPLQFMQIRGIKVDEAGIRNLGRDVAEQISDKQKQLDFIIGDRLPLSTKAQRKNYEYERLNPGSSQQCCHYFYNILKFKVQTKTMKDNKTGEKKTAMTADAKAMGRLARMYRSEEALLVKTISALRTLKGTFLDMGIDKDGRLRCRFKMLTNSGRLSSSESLFGTGGNMQNLPPSFKEFLIADDGMIFCNLDKAQAEWVASAYIFNDANMIKAVEDRADIHIRTAAMMFKAPEDVIKIGAGYIEEATDELYIAEQRQKMLEETGLNVLQYNPLPNMSMRQSGKKCNHSFNYGLSPNGFSIQYDMPLPFSRRCYSLYHSGYPGIHLGHKTIERELTNTRTLVNLFGRKRRFLGRMDDDLFKAAYSYKPQSSIGELLNRGIVTTYYDQYSTEHADYMKPQELLNQVHDSLLFQYPITTNEDVINFTHCILRTTKNLTIPMTVNGRTFNVRTDGKIGFNGKKMEKITIDKGFDACYESVVKAITKLRTQEPTKPIELIDNLANEMEDIEDSENEITE